MLTTSLLLLLVTAGDDPPRYQGGHKAIPLEGAPDAEDRVSVLACTPETLKTSHNCVFDGRPGAASDTKAQATANTTFALQLGVSLCKARTEPMSGEAREKAEKIKQCTARVQQATPGCSLDGKVGLVDGEGRFGPSAKACYISLAEALQSMDTPPAPPERQTTRADL